MNNAYIKYLDDVASRNHTIEIEAKEIIEKAKEEAMAEMVTGLYENDVPIPVIAKYMKITEERVRQIIDNHKNKSH